jgi:hypothetical protein
MPKVLTKLRIDEISCVDRAAGENTRVVLMKRRDDDEPPSVYHRIFAGDSKSSGHALRKYNRYGGHLRHRPDGNLDRATALHWLLHDSHGAAVLNRVNLSADETADLLVCAAQMHRTEKVSNHKEENHMRENFDVVAFSKRVVDDNVSAISEATATSLISKYCDANKLPGEKSSWRSRVSMAATMPSD